jgi:hypothetical protein
MEEDKIRYIISYKRYGWAGNISDFSCIGGGGIVRSLLYYNMWNDV